MKRYNNIYKIITNVAVIMDMYDNTISKNTKNKSKIEMFDRFYIRNIFHIKKLLDTHKYIPGKYNIFLVREPKLRIIMSQEIPDKIVNHLVAKYFLSNLFDKTLILENCATRIGMGTHYALRIFKNYYNQYKNKYEKFYILKFDISKYFYNIDHNVAKEIIKNKIKDKYALQLIFSIIDSTDESYVNDTINKLKSYELIRISNMNISDKENKIDEIKKLPIYKKGKGLPIGNMSSQIIATFYLDTFDHFIKDTLNIKCYCRYMDDGILFHYDKEYLKQCLDKIRTSLSDFKLELNNKSKIYSSNEEIEFLGFRFYINNNKIVSKLTNKTKKKFKKKMKKVYSQYDNLKITYDELRSVRDSYSGHLKFGNCGNLYYYNIRKDNK